MNASLLVPEQAVNQRKLSVSHQQRIINKSSSPNLLLENENPHSSIQSTPLIQVVSAKNMQETPNAITQPPKQEKNIRENTQFIVKKWEMRLYQTQKSQDEVFRSKFM